MAHEETHARIPSNSAVFGRKIDEILEKGAEDTSDLVNFIIDTAVDQRASDLHFDPDEDGVRVTCRIDGALVPLATLPKELSKRIVNYCKVIADLRTDKTAIPQDGHVSDSRVKMPVDMRLCTCPTVWGETVSIRLFQHEGHLDRLDQLGMPDDVLQELHNVLDMQDGLMMICGPAGSGKTTTLYACLRHLTEDGETPRRVATVEDPVEKQLSGTMQTGVKRAMGYDFPDALRSILRHDIDAIMVGEVRDTETARIAVEASLTGHLVLSTVHAGRAFTAPHRMLELEVDPFSFVGGLRLILAQRLVRSLRPECSRPASREERSEMPPEIRDDALVAAKLDEGGFPSFGRRILLAEKLTASEELRKAIMDRAPVAAFRELASREGSTLGEQAMEAVRNGRTTWREVRRVLAGEGTL